MWSFKETRETRKELIFKGGGEGSCFRKRAKLERNLYPREGGGKGVLFKETSQTRKELISKGGGGGFLFKETSQTRKELISKVEGEGSPHWFHFYFKVYRVPRRGCAHFF